MGIRCGRLIFGSLLGALVYAALGQDGLDVAPERSNQRSDHTMSTTQPSAADATAIGRLVDDLSAAWSRGDARGMAALYQEDGTFTNVFGTVHFGRSAFEERHR